MCYLDFFMPNKPPFPNFTYMKYLLSLLLLCLGFFSCKKSTNAPGIYSLKVTINGDTSWSTTNVQTSTYGGYVYVSGTRPKTGEIVNLTIANYSGVDNYNISNTNPSLTTYGSYAEYVGYGIIRGFEAETGIITVTKNASNSITGSFYFQNSGGGVASGTYVAPHP